MLPPELLIKILVQVSPSPLCLRSTADSSSFVIDDSNDRSLLPALSVCSRWRQIALDSRDFWDRVVIDYPSYAPTGKKAWAANVQAMTSMARTIISRGTRYIDIRIDADANRKIRPLGDDHPMKHLIFPFSSQLVDIVIMCSMQHLGEFLRSSPSSFAALRSVVFHGPSYALPSLQPKAPFKWPVFQNAPNLRSLKNYSFFSEMSNPFSQTGLGLPFDQLTEVILNGSFLSLDATLTLLSQCTSVIKCCVCLLHGAESSAPLPHIVHPRLESLTITSSLPTSIIAARFLDNLTLPCLHTFGITGNLIHENCLPALISLISRSNCVLHCFSAGASILTGFLDPLLEVMPMLTNLIIPEVTVPIRMLEHISQGLILPKLTTLNCTIISSPHSLEAFMEAVDRSGVGDSGYGATQLEFAMAKYPAAERYHSKYRTPQWIQVKEKFKAFESKLLKEGRLVSIENEGR
ncbi:hypothetical protein H0H92_005609 [Tricholoma furcatifolium]|nr:hypothetical protein H0H92_005609 [Tricholoma furcatifolium]